MVSIPGGRLSSGALERQNGEDVSAASSDGRIASAQVKGGLRGRYARRLLPPSSWKTLALCVKSRWSSAPQIWWLIGTFL